MSIRKHKSKIALCIALLFWAACDNDSSTVPDIETPPASSESSETDVSNSSGPEYPYILAIHPSVHCKDSTFFQKASCKNTAVQKDSSDIKLAAPLYSAPCISEDRNSPIFKCEDGSMFSNRKNSSFLVGDTIVQFTDLCEELMRADECIAQKAEEAEANPESPYKLARDTTINCKQTFRPRLERQILIADGFESEFLLPEVCFKCDDGYTYDGDDMLKDGNGNLWKKEN